MFVERTSEGKIKKLTMLSKSIVSACALIAAISGGLFFMEDRYFNTADAKEMKKILEADAVKTFQMQQKMLETQQQALEKSIEMEQRSKERDYDLRYLEQLRCQKVLIQKELNRDPNDTLLKDKLERIIDLIEKLENKLFGG
jgi:hypothetical protein